ncbi:hypothetical protein O6H91_16G047500 [Diphasiastrum complanatum]|uniref:Uncharacterized protein n=1 Tax=Diphasiastrum complanatum TaxID=34168 RepID=A0ACC2BBZ6_DIPCM|nr:hypothetical protein O6H91_16G047500 [Diphasiastrum complanatum]
MGGGGDWFYPGIEPFQFVNEKGRNFYGSQTGAFWQDADSRFTRKPVYTPDAPSYGRNRALAGGEANRRWNETRFSNIGKPEVTSIHVQDGNAESPKSGNVEGKKLHPPQDLEGRVSGQGKGILEGVNAVRSVEKLKKFVPVIVSQNSAASDGACGAMMSDNVAAALIQSHFRGYMVRRTVPLNSLRLISSVMSKLRKLKAQISTDEYMDELRADSKERLKLSETIMSLLLRLDALQGVHFTVREIRKAAVREAMALQETVDSLLKHGIFENLQNSKLSPTVGFNRSVNGSDTEKHLEAAPVTNLVSVSENIEGIIGSNVPVEIIQSPHEENETRHLGQGTNHYMTSDEILKIDERYSDDRRGMATPSHTTEDHTSVATEFPRFTLGDDAMEHEDAELSCKNGATSLAPSERGIICYDQNMKEKGSVLQKNCARKVGSTLGEDLQRSCCHENLRSIICFDYENDQFRNDAEEGEQHLDDVDRKPLLQDLISQETAWDVSANSCVESDSDILHLLQNANEELKSTLKRCQMTNDSQTTLIRDLRERLLLLERQLEEKSKTATKSSSKWKKRSSRRGRFSERRLLRNRNAFKHWHDYWIEDENYDVAAGDDRQDISD